MIKRHLMALATLALGVGAVHATTNMDLATNNLDEAKYTQWITLDGTIESIDTENDMIQIKTENGTVRDFALSPDVNVERNNQTAEVSELSVGDQVKIHYLRDGRLVTTVKSQYDNDIMTP